MNSTVTSRRNDVAIDFLAVNNEGNNALLYAGGVVNLDDVGVAAETTGDSEALHLCGDAGINHQTGVVSADTENVLGDVEEGPGCSTGQPGVLCLAVVLCIAAGYHLRVDIGLGAVNLADLLNVCRADLAVNLECSVAAADNGLSNGNPGVVVAEDTSILLVSRRIGRDFAEVQMIGLIRRLLENNTVLGIEALLDGVKSLDCKTFLDTDACEYAEALRLDENLTLFALLGADLLLECIVSAEEPFAVPAVLENCIVHLVDLSLCAVSLFVETLQAAHLDVILTDSNELTCNEDRFSLAALKAGGSLEGLARSLGEAVEVEAVVPVSTTDEGETVRSEVGYNMIKGSLEVVDEGLRSGRIGIERSHVIEDVDIAGLLDVCSNTEDKPHGVVVEAGACVRVALLGERLILMVCRAVLKLNRSDVDDSLACVLRNEVDETGEVLAGVTEAHAAADTALEVGSGTGHIEGDHALILVPDVDHAVHLLVIRLYLIAGEEIYPVFLELCKSCIELLSGVVLGKHLVCGLLVDDVESFPLVILRILAVTEGEDVILAFARSQLNLDAVGTDGCPAACHGVLGLACENNVGLAETVVETKEGLTVGVEAADRSVDGEDRVVVAALAVLGLVVDGAADDLNLADGEVSLEVGHIIVSIPQTELNKAEELDLLCGVSGVGQGDLVELTGGAHRDHSGLGGSDAALCRGDLGIAKTVTALVAVELSLDRLPAEGPYVAAVIDVEVTSACIGGNVVVAITGKTKKTSILVEAVAAGSVREQTEEVLTAQIVDPGVGGIRSGYTIFSGSIVKETEFHSFPPNNNFITFGNLPEDRLHGCTSDPVSVTSSGRG